MKIDMNSLCCPNNECGLYSKIRIRNIARHSFYKTRSGKKRRFICTSCKSTFSYTKGSVYFRLQKSKKEFDDVIHMSIEGQSISSIARIKNISRNTVAAWLLKASERSKDFQDKHLRGYEVCELQFDEMKTFVSKKKNDKWIFTSLEVSSRLWSSTVIGRRSHSNTGKIITETISKGNVSGKILIATDGFQPYEHKIKSLIGNMCIYVQVIKTIKKNKVVSVDRRYVIGTKDSLEEKLRSSEDSNTINTAFIERHNLTVRQSSAYLSRKTLSHARNIRLLEANLNILRFFYNFSRPHMALKFGGVMKTPAMQAGITSRVISFRELFSQRILLLYLILHYYIKIRYQQHLSEQAPKIRRIIY